MFEISPLNPIRFVPILDWNKDDIQTIPFDKGLQEEQTRDEYQDPKKYYQKFIFIDTPRIQILSSYTDILVQVRKCCDGQPECTQEVVQIPTVVDTEAGLSYNFQCYEFDVTCSMLEKGKYDALISYVDENDNTIEWVSEPFEIRESWPKTRKFVYSHSRNDDFIFKHRIDDANPYVGVMRLECDVIEFKPSSIDTIYPDQVQNVTEVRGVPFRQYTLNLGGDGELIPDYKLDQVNRILTLNQWSLDDQYYSKSEGAQWEENRQPGERFSEQKITITESQNRFQYQVNGSGLTPETIAVKDTMKFIDNNSGSIVVNNKFKKYTLHEYITIFNPTGATFVLTIQATSVDGIGDMPLQTFEFSGQLIRHYPFEFPFDRPKTYTITWNPGTLLSIFVGWERQDATGGGGGVVGASGGRKRTMYMYHGTPEEFALDFDADTGLGVIGGIYEGCAVCNGNNNTPNVLERMIIGTDGLTNIVEFPPSTGGGSWLKAIDLTNLPVMFFNLFKKTSTLNAYTAIDGNDIAASMSLGNVVQGFDQYRIGKATEAGEPNAGRTNKLGGSSGDGSTPAVANFSVKGKYYRAIIYKQLT